MVESNEKLSKTVFGKIKLQYTDYDPYKNFADMIEDVLVNKHLAVYDLVSSDHKGLSPEQNNLFRAVHDMIGHVGGNSQAFYSQLLKKYTSGSTEKYKPVWGSSFTVRGEMNAYLSHTKMVPEAAVPALYTEIVGQICTYFVTGNYADNKTAIIEGIDYYDIGKCYGTAKARMDEIMMQYMDKDIKEIKTSVDGISIDKSKIRWKLLSHGTGAGNIT